MRRILAAFAALVAVDAASGCGTDIASRTTTTTTSGPQPPVASPTTIPPPVNTSVVDALETAYLNDEASDRAYWQRTVEMLSEQDTATLNPEDDVSITIVHEGESVTLYRDDLGSIAYNSCLGLADGTAAAETVGWITDAFELQRRWEAAQIRLAAIETKCPTLSR